MMVTGLVNSRPPGVGQFIRRNRAGEAVYEGDLACIRVGIRSVDSFVKRAVGNAADPVVVFVGRRDRKGRPRLRDIVRHRVGRVLSPARSALASRTVLRSDPVVVRIERSGDEIPRFQPKERGENNDKHKNHFHQHERVGKIDLTGEKD